MNKRWSFRVWDREIRKLENKLKLMNIGIYFNNCIVEIEQDNKVIVFDYDKFVEIKKAILW
jgi:hypothetical protein